MYLQQLLAHNRHVYAPGQSQTPSVRQRGSLSADEGRQHDAQVDYMLLHGILGTNLYHHSASEVVF